MTADLDKVFKALADPGRRLLLDRLHVQNGQTLGQLCQHLDMTRQAVTKHLKLLEGASLVVTLRRGREKLHYLNPVPIHQIADRWIGKYERGRLRALAELKKKLASGRRGSRGMPRAGKLAEFRLPGRVGLMCRQTPRRVRPTGPIGDRFPVRRAPPSPSLSSACQ